MSLDINELSRRVIYHSDTLTNLLTINKLIPWELEICREKFVQEATNTLLDKGIRKTNNEGQL